MPHTSCEHRIALLAKALGDIAVAVGVIDGTQGLTGPELLHVASEIEKWAATQSQRKAPAATRAMLDRLEAEAKAEARDLTLKTILGCMPARGIQVGEDIDGGGLGDLMKAIDDRLAERHAAGVAEERERCAKIAGTAELIDEITRRIREGRP